MRKKKVQLVNFGGFQVPYEMRNGIKEIANRNGLNPSDIAREAFEMRIDFDKMTRKKRR